MFSEKAGNATGPKRKPRVRPKHLRRSNKTSHPRTPSTGLAKRPSSPNSNLSPHLKAKTVLKLDLKAKLLEVRRRGQSKRASSKKRANSKETPHHRNRVLNLKKEENKGLKCFVKRQISSEKIKNKSRAMLHSPKSKKSRLHFADYQNLALGEQNALSQKEDTVNNYYHHKRLAESHYRLDNLQNKVPNQAQIREPLAKRKSRQVSIGRRSRVLKNSQKANINKVKSGQKIIQSPGSVQNSKNGLNKLKGLKKTAKKRKTSRKKSKNKSRSKDKRKSKMKYFLDEREEKTENLLIQKDIDTVIEAFNERSRQIDKKISLRKKIRAKNVSGQNSERKNDTRGKINII